MFLVTHESFFYFFLGLATWLKDLWARQIREIDWCGASSIQYMAYSEDGPQKIGPSTSKSQEYRPSHTHKKIA